MATTDYASITSSLSLRAMPISHGCTESSGVYDSTAFFVRHDASDKEFLFFGDVEPDALSSSPRTLAVWQAAAPLIPLRLNAIFLECSWSDSRPDSLLFGHLSPRHFVKELCALAREVVDVRSARRDTEDSQSSSPPLKRRRLNGSNTSLKGSLSGLRVYVTHCKETFSDDRPPEEVIAAEIRDLMARHELGLEVIAVRQGTRIGT